MSKPLVTALGLIVSLGVIALGVFLVALPLYFQAAGVDAQTAAVASTNAIYQAEVDNLRKQEENLETINAEVDGLRSQIPAAAQLDDVFEVVARAAQASGVTLTAVTAGDQAAFVPGGAVGDDLVAPSPAPEPSPTDGAEGTDAASAPAPGDAGSSTTGRQQVDFVIRATATDMAQATTFVDALRAGPRLLSTVTVTSTQSGESAVEVQVAALTYIDTER